MSTTKTGRMKRKGIASMVVSRPTTSSTTRMRCREIYVMPSQMSRIIAVCFFGVGSPVGLMKPVSTTEMKLSAAMT